MSLNFDDHLPIQESRWIASVGKSIHFSRVAVSRMLYLKSPLTDLEETFAIFHDSSIETWSGDLSALRLTIECVYLAERVKKSYRNFIVQFGAIQKLELHQWAYPPDVEDLVVTELQDIFLDELEIVSAKKKKEYVEIMCFQHRYPRDRRGATLHINCETISIFDQGNQPVSAEQLSHLCSDYWDDFSKRAQRPMANRSPQSSSSYPRLIP